jgi:hypothetical protein
MLSVRHEAIRPIWTWLAAAAALLTLATSSLLALVWLLTHSD